MSCSVAPAAATCSAARGSPTRWWGGRGNDTLVGHHGADVMLGGAGSDSLGYDGLDRRLDGGSGEDTLSLAVGLNLDPRDVGDEVLRNFERIDLNRHGPVTLTFDLHDMLALTERSTLRSDGDAGDTVSSALQGWTQGSPVSIDGQQYQRYTSGAALLLVDADIVRLVT